MGFLMVIMAVIIIGLAFVFFFQTAIVPQIKSSTEEITMIVSGNIGTVRSATSACESWRSPQSFYDPAALSVGMIEAINRAFPGIRCSQDTPLGCERACACMLKLSRYCHIGESGSSVDACKGEPCRVEMEG